MDFEQFFSKVREQTIAALACALDQCDIAEPQLASAIHYVVLGGGKRIRPLLVYGAAQAVTSNPIDWDFLTVPALAVELMHCYSLVHDDLPAMDDDALRRGQPTCHLAYSEATAILVGDALQTLAFELLVDAPQNALVKLSMIKKLAVASGCQGMVAGQAIDLSVVGQVPELATLKQMYQLKTGALIGASVALGAMAQGCQEQAVLSALEDYADHIGLAFQIQDDILDVTACDSLLGKQTGADAKQAKPTYVALLGLSGARDLLHFSYAQALESLKHCPGDSSPLSALADYIVDRDH